MIRQVHFDGRSSYLFMLRRSKLQSRIVLLPHLVMSIVTDETYKVDKVSLSHSGAHTSMISLSSRFLTCFVGVRLCAFVVNP